MTCDNCGVCCLHMGSPPFEETHMPTGEPCTWYDPATKRCKHYEERPKMCRDFEPGCQDCLDLRIRMRVDER